jgi:vitamin B12 transporter
VLRSVPGVTVIESGGPGGSAEVRLRGAETGHTLVLIDGVRVNDFATARDDFDFALISPNDIERIEILRGPQSAVYGSDAIGGVINIITRKPAAGMSASAKIEGGSYGTHTERLSGNMSLGDFAMRFSGSYFSSEGFSRRGDPDENEPDGTEKWAGSASAVYAPVDGAKVEVGVNAFDQFSEYDAAVGLSAADAPNTVDRTSVSGYGRITLPEFAGRFEQSLTGFFLDTSRDNLEPGGSLPVSLYDATAVGAEYQGNLDLERLGTLLVGARVEHEAARNVAETATDFPGYESDRFFYAGYLLHQLSPVDDLYLTFGGRYDGEIDGEGFLTGRATAAYEIPETGTTLRASVGTGAKRPTAYQIGNNLFAAIKYPLEDVNTDLQPEKSVGIDASIEQSLFNGVLDVSVTGFYNRFNDLLVFESIAFPDGAYANIDSAETAGVEVAADADILPGLLRGGVTYTYLYSRNLETDTPLPRRPEHSAAFDLTFIGSDRFEMTLSGILVGERFNTSSSTTPLPGYGRLDLSAKYVLAPGTELLARIENLTDVEYQDPSGFNAPGLSGYVGLSWTY